MDLPDEATLTYVLEHEAHYADALDEGKTPAVSVVAAAAGGMGAHWEFRLREQQLLGGVPALRLEMFDDAFAAFSDIPEFFAALREHQPTTVAAAVELLKPLGAVDTTKRQEVRQ